jgi:hypothetical protein
MQRLVLAVVVLAGCGTAVAVFGSKKRPSQTTFPRADRNPVTHLRWNDDPREFQFAIVSDRTGGHRADVFSQAIEKLNLLQPAFVLSVGDLVEGGTQEKQLAAQWKEFDGYAGRLTMPFFYVAGNHDVGNAASAKFWQEKLGRRYYHFLYRDVLFLVLNTDDPPGGKGSLGQEQIAYAQKVLRDNPDVRWTIVALHRPLWTAADGANNGWRDVERALAGRRYTVFAGHIHRYQKFVRNGMSYYQLATTGGTSLVRGPERGEFDHVVWVTMKEGGPLFANLMLDAIQSENLQRPQTNEPGSGKGKRRPTYPVAGKAFFDGVPMPGAVVTLQSVAGGKAKGSRAVGVVAADGSFTLSTYRANDGAPAGDYEIGVVWRDPVPDGPPRTGASRLPARYTTPVTSGLRVTIRPEPNTLTLELHR